jgi:hypothetical protein
LKNETNLIVTFPRGQAGQAAGSGEDSDPPGVRGSGLLSPWTYLEISPYGCEAEGYRENRKIKNSLICSNKNLFIKISAE